MLFVFLLFLLTDSATSTEIYYQPPVHTSPPADTPLPTVYPTAGSPTPDRSPSPQIYPSPRSSSPDSSPSPVYSFSPIYSSPPVYSSPPIYSSPPPAGVCDYSDLVCYDQVTGELDANCQCNLGGVQASGSYPAPHDCTKFLYCQEQHEARDGSLVGAPSLGYIFNCPAGLFYNILLGVCDWPDRIVRSKSSDVLNAAVTAVDCCPIQPLVIASESECYKGDGSYNATCFCNIGGPKQSGQFASPADCTQFISCVYNRGFPTIGYNIDCPPSTYYNEALAVCDSMSKLSDEELGARCPELVDEQLLLQRVGGSDSGSSNLLTQGEVTSADEQVSSANTPSSNTGGSTVSTAGIALAAVGGVAAIVGFGSFIASRRRSTSQPVTNSLNSTGTEPNLLPVAVPAGRVGNLVMGDSENLRQRTPRGGSRGNDRFI